MTSRLMTPPLDAEASVALEARRARMRETSAARRAERLHAAAEREERWFSQPGPLALVRSRTTRSPWWRRATDPAPLPGAASAAATSPARLSQ
jgi:hypothetical protein